MNIMGFPNAAGVHDQNLGLLDQRTSLEWVRDNIKYFGKCHQVVSGDIM